MNIAEIVPLSVVIVAACYAAATDIHNFKVYHHLTVPLFASGILFRSLAGGWTGLEDSLAGACFGLGSLLLFFVFGGMGAGDVKLMAGIGAWLGMPLTFHVFLAASLAAGVYATALIVVHHGLGGGLIYLQLSWLRVLSPRRWPGQGCGIAEERKRADRKRRLIPFAAMILVGLIGVIIWNHAGELHH